MSRDRNQWSPADTFIVRKLYPSRPTKEVAWLVGRTEEQVYRKAKALGLNKTAKYLASPHACRLRQGGNVGAAYQYPKGHVPANKGLRRPGFAPGRMAQTQFQPGVRQGRAAAAYQPVGAERISKDGYLERKINEDLPFQRRWRAVHILLWEEHLGPLPPRHCVSFKNGVKADIRIDNLALISWAERMRRNTIHRYQPELKQAIRAHSKLKRTIRNCHEKQTDRSA